MLNYRIYSYSISSVGSCTEIMKMRYKTADVAAADDVIAIDSLRIGLIIFGSMNGNRLSSKRPCTKKHLGYDRQLKSLSMVKRESKRKLMHYHLWADKERWIIYYVDHQRLWSASIIRSAQQMRCWFILRRHDPWFVIHEWVSAWQTQIQSALFLSFSHLWRHLNGDWMAA